MFPKNLISHFCRSSRLLCQFFNMTKTKKAKNGKISDAEKAEDLSQDAIPKDGTAETVTGHDTTLFNTEEVILDIDNQASIANPSMYLTQDSLATAVDMNTENTAAAMILTPTIRNLS